MTEKKRFGLTMDILAKIDKQAIAYGKIPAVVIEFSKMQFGVEPTRLDVVVGQYESQKVDIGSQTQHGGLCQGMVKGT